MKFTGCDFPNLERRASSLRSHHTTVAVEQAIQHLISSKRWPLQAIQQLSSSERWLLQVFCRLRCTGLRCSLSSLCMTMTSAPDSIHCSNNPLIFALSAGLSISSPRAEAIGIPTPPRFNRRLVGFAKKPSMALSHDREAGLPRHLSDVAYWHA